MDLLVKINSTITDRIIQDFNTRGVTVHYVSEPFRILHVTLQSIDSLKTLDFIESVEANDIYETQNLQYVPNIRVHKVKNAGFTGVNATVAVIDTGIDPVLTVQRNEICSSSSTPNDSKTIHGSLHGTYVAQIIKDLAPWSNIVNLKVADDSKDIKKSSIVKALTFAYTNNIKIINMSLGRKKSCDSSCQMCQIVEQMADEGFLIVAAIGNYGQEGVGITGCPGNSPKALTVSAVGPNRELAEYSSTAMPGIAKPDILAPGRALIGKEVFDGTSCATPVVTGIIAGLSDQYDLKVIVDVIKRTSRSIGLFRNQQGFGLMHVENLLEVLANEKSINQGQK